MTEQNFLSKYENNFQLYNSLKKQLEEINVPKASSDSLQDVLFIYDKNLSLLSDNQKVYLINFLNEIRNYENSKEFDFSQKDLENIKWNAFKISLNTINKFFKNNPKNQKLALDFFQKSDKNYKKIFLDFFIDKKYLERKKYFFYSLREMTGQERAFLPPSNANQKDLFPHLFLLLCDKNIQLKDIKVYFDSIYKLSKKNGFPNIGQLLNGFTLDEQKKIFHNKDLLKQLRAFHNKDKSISKEELKNFFQVLINKNRKLKKQIIPKTYSNDKRKLNNTEAIRHKIKNRNKKKIYKY